MKNNMDKIEQQIDLGINKREVDGQINLFETVKFIWTRKIWIIAASFITSLFGIGYLFIAKPEYYASAVISPKTPQQSGGASAILSQLGGIGGQFASQLGLASTNIDKIEVIIKTQDLAKSIVIKNDMLPLIYKNIYDEKSQKWKVEKQEQPTAEQAAGMISGQMLQISSLPQKNLMKIGIISQDSVLSALLVSHYLRELNLKLQEYVKLDAEANQKYLMEQVGKTTDPTLREKLLTLIGMEVEKSLLMVSSSFDVLERPLVPHQKFRPKGKMILIISFAIGSLLSTVCLLILYAVKSGAYRKNFALGV